MLQYGDTPLQENCVGEAQASRDAGECTGRTRQRPGPQPSRGAAGGPLGLRGGDVCRANSRQRASGLHQRAHDLLEVLLF